METLVEMAKRLGIKPNPGMTDEEYQHIKALMIQELKKIGKTPQNDLDLIVYDFRKNTPSGTAQYFNKDLLNQNLENFKQNFLPGISSRMQSDGGFWYHSANHDNVETCERFVADIKLDDPGISEIYKRLDAFILKHKSSYKIKMDGNRTDTLNLYMPEPITPQIAGEFYEIVKPVLQTKNHIYLDGYPIKQNGWEILGVKFGPEPMREISRNDDFIPMKKRLESVLPFRMVQEITQRYLGKLSLGQVAAKIQLGDFLYYLIGREGQNPIQFGNQLGDPQKHYSKTSIDITDTAGYDRGTTPSPSPSGVSTSVNVPKEMVSMQDLLQQMQEMRSKIQDTYSQLQQLRQGNAQLKENLENLNKEKMMLLSENRALKAQVQIGAPSLTAQSKSPTI